MKRGRHGVVTTMMSRGHTLPWCQEDMPQWVRAHNTLQWYRESRTRLTSEVRERARVWPCHSRRHRHGRREMAWLACTESSSRRARGTRPLQTPSPQPPPGRRCRIRSRGWSNCRGARQLKCRINRVEQKRERRGLEACAESDRTAQGRKKASPLRMCGYGRHSHQRRHPCCRPRWVRTACHIHLALLTLCISPSCSDITPPP